MGVHELIPPGPVAIEGLRFLVTQVESAARLPTGQHVKSLAGKRVTTVEGLASDGSLSPLQQAFVDEQAGQCGYCLSGILISAAALLARNPRPSRSEIAAALDRHLCRCGVHNRIMRAVARAGASIGALP